MKKAQKLQGDYHTIGEAASRQDISRQRVALLAKQGRIAGAVRFGRAWAIPADWEYIRLKPGEGSKGS